MLELDLDTIWLIHESLDDDIFIEWCIEMDKEFYLNVILVNGKLQLYSLKHFDDLLDLLQKKIGLDFLIYNFMEKFPIVQFPNGDECGTEIIFNLLYCLRDVSDQNLIHHHDTHKLNILISELYLTLRDEIKYINE